jgi:hypothetical protein
MADVCGDQNGAALPIPKIVIYGGTKPILAHRPAFMPLASYRRSAENGLDKGKIEYGHGWFRTSDLSRVKRALSR